MLPIEGVESDVVALENDGFENVFSAVHSALVVADSKESMSTKVLLTFDGEEDRDGDKTVGASSVSSSSFTALTFGEVRESVVGISVTS